MDRVLKPTWKLIEAAIVVVVGVIALYLFALLNMYMIAWVVQILSNIF